MMSEAIHPRDRRNRLLTLILLLALVPGYAVGAPLQGEALREQIGALKFQQIQIDTELRIKTSPQSEPAPAVEPTNSKTPADPGKTVKKKKKKKRRIEVNTIEDAKRFQTQGETLNAIATYKAGRYLERISDNVSNELFLASLYAEVGLFKNAEAIISETVENSEPEEYTLGIAILAQISYRKGRWREAIDLFEQIDYETLKRAQAQTRLFHGITLERLKRYKDAVQILSLIPEDAPGAVFAQLNIAIADIRQGWWSDGEKRMERLAARIDEDNAQERALVDRFYTSIGYSQLQRQYYRQARNSFRKVSITGPYSNRALLGLTLAAMEQDDYRLALKLAMRLRDKGGDDLTAQEALLLVPYLLDKLKQDKQSFALYQKAIVHYQNEIARIEGIGTRLDSAYLRQEIFSPRHDGALLNLLPAPVFADINAYRSEIRALAQRNAALNTRIDTALAHKKLKAGDAQAFKRQLEFINAETSPLQTNLSALSQGAVEDALTTRKTQLQSYISQARFGLASLYDNSSVQTVRPGEDE